MKIKNDYIKKIERSMIVFLFWYLSQYLIFKSFLKNISSLNILFSLSILFFILYLGYSYREIIILSFIFIIICPVLIILKQIFFSNYIAINIFITSIFSVSLYIFNGCSNNKETKKMKSKKNIFKYLSIFFLICFILLTVLINFSGIKLKAERTKLELARIILDSKVFILSNVFTEKYFKEIKFVSVDGVNYNNRMDFYIDSNTPPNNYKVSGKFVIEGWAIDASKLENSCIDYVCIYLNNKPQDDGIFLTDCRYGKYRPDIENIFGKEFKYSGFSCVVDTSKLDDGLKRFYIYIHSNNFGWKYTTIDLFINNK